MKQKWHIHPATRYVDVAGFFDARYLKQCRPPILGYARMASTLWLLAIHPDHERTLEAALLVYGTARNRKR